MTDPVTDLTQAATAQARQLLSGPPSPQALAQTLRLLAKWRSALLDNALVQRSGTQVLAGPFQGMHYPVRASEGARAARLLGGYEASLHPVIEQVIQRAYPQVIDVGCAEGYYAVGLARRMPATTVLARDMDEKARALCTELARVNGVSDRVQVGGVFTHADFDLCLAADTLVICDIEGAEDALLDPGLAPALASADILVEVHEGMAPGLWDRLTARFQPTHTITRLDRALRPDLLPAWTEALSDIDRLILLWEWRASPTPWAWMQAT